MELTHLNQIDFGELRSERINCFIASIGNQPRCHHLAEKLHTVIPHKILLTTGKEDSRKASFVPVFNEFGFSNYILPSNESQGISKLLNDLCNFNAHQINILIDYTCMPKKWYALFIDCVTRDSYLAERVNLFFSYTPKFFERKPGKPGIDYLGPIILNRDNLNEKKPVSVIASLDNNHNTLIDAVAKIKPKKLLAFVPHFAHDPEYTQLVIENNKSLLNRLDSNSIINYDAGRPEEINTLLTSYCLDERMHSEVMIIPQGPKTFSMMSILLSVRYPDVKLWEIILRDQKQASDHGQPAGTPVIVKVSFISDELD